MVAHSGIHLANTWTVHYIGKDTVSYEVKILSMATSMRGRRDLFGMKEDLWD